MGAINSIAPNQVSAGITRQSTAVRGRAAALPGANGELTPQQQQRVAELKKRDAQVRRHEQAHIAAAGGFARGGANFTYTTGPDGKRYATGGEVSIDVSAESSPQATISKMQTIQRAALAPEDPSAQDRRVASSAARAEAQARQQLAKQDTEATGKTNAAESPRGKSGGDSPGASPPESPGFPAYGASSPANKFDLRI